MTAPVPPTGPGTGDGGRPGPQITVPDPLCGHLPGDVHDDECAYWIGVARGEYPSPDAYLADGPVFTLPAHAPGLAPLTDPALAGEAA